MAKPRRPGGPKQKLSPKARAAKAKRDLAYAKTPRRRKMKAETQAKRRAAKKAGHSVSGKDWDHRTGRFTTTAFNRGGGGKGTKKEKTMAKQKTKPTRKSKMMAKAKANNSRKKMTPKKLGPMPKGMKAKFMKRKATNNKIRGKTKK